MNFNNTKVRISNPKESEAVQNKMFSLGIDWRDCGKEVSNTNEPFLYFEDGRIIHDDSEVTFNTDPDSEVTVKDILGGKAPKVKPDDLVKYMAYGTGCNNRSKIVETDKELKELLDRKVKDSDWSGRIIGYKLVPLYEAELQTKFKVFKTTAIKKVKKSKK